MTKVAQYKDLEYGYTTISDEGLSKCNSYVRITEYVDVAFRPLPAEVTVPAEVEALEKAKEAARQKYAEAAAKIDERISKLLAITHQPAAA